jgi:thiol:disulfide interchange protein DsbD
VAGLIGTAAAPVYAADDADHVSVALISEHMALAPGQSLELGILLKHEPHWHTYWINPGDSGLETRLKWTLPKGYSAGEVAWPAPHRLAAGDLTNYGYVGEIVLPVPVHVPRDARPGHGVEIAVATSWLVCEDICIPGKAKLSMTLPVRASARAEPQWQDLFAGARAAIPVESGWTGEARMREGEVEITLRGAGLPDTDGLDLFPVQGQLLEASRPSFERRGEVLVARATRSLYFTTAPARIELVLTGPDGGASRAWRASVPLILAGPDPVPH